VVGGVEADILEVVVLATSADAFLGVSRAGILRGLRAGPPGDVGLPVAEMGSSEADGTMVWSCFAKKSRKLWRISALVIANDGYEPRRRRGHGEMEGEWGSEVRGKGKMKVRGAAAI